MLGFTPQKLGLAFGIAFVSESFALLGTVMDGDCGIDVECQMLSFAQTAIQRAALREDISDYYI